jgi:hypothetical protein
VELVNHRRYGHIVCVVQDLSSTSRWPHYERQCRERMAALKQVNGEFRRAPGDEAFAVSMLLVLVGAGSWMFWATTVGRHRWIEAPWN